MADETIRIEWSDPESAREAYESGLRHGLVTTRVDPPPRQGSTCRVELVLSFADTTFDVEGVVTTSTPETTAIWVPSVPEEVVCFLIELGGGEAAEEASPKAPPKAPPTAEVARPARLSFKNSTPSAIRSERVHRVVRPPPSRAAEKDRDRRRQMAEASLDRELTWDQVKQADEPEIPAAEEESVESSFEQTLELPPPTSTETTFESLPVVDEPRHSMDSLDDEAAGIPVPHRPGLYRPGVVEFSESLDNTPMYQVLMRLFAEELTGVAVIDLEDERTWVHIVAGSPVHIISDPPRESESVLSMFLQRKILLEPVADHVQLIADVAARSVESVLLGLKLVDADQLDEVRAERVRLITMRLLASQEGRFRFFSLAEIGEVVPTVDADIVDTLWKQAQSSFSHLPETRIQGHYVGLRRQYVALTPMGRKVTPRLPVTGQQRAFVDKLRRPGRQVQRLIKSSAAAKRHAVEMLMTLRLLGVISLSPHPPEDRKQVKLERQLRERFQRMEADHFGFLGVHWSALPEEMSAACESAEREMHEFSVLGNSITNFGVMRDAFTQRIDEIRGLVDEEDRRREYRATLVAEDDRGMAAEAYLKQGETALFRGDANQARDSFRRLMEIEGDTDGDRVQRARIALMAMKQGGSLDSPD